MDAGAGRDEEATVRVHRSISWVFLAVVASCLALIPEARAQQAKMYGKINDASGAPVAGVKIVLEPVEEGARVSASTNKKGSYFFGLIRPGVYNVVVVAEGSLVRNLKAKAIAPDKSTAYDLDGAVDPNKPPQLQIGDGFEIACDLTLGVALTVSDASGASKKATPEEVVQAITKQVKSGDCAGALPQIEAFLRTIADNAMVHYLAGFCQASTGKGEQAVASLARTLELQPGFEGAAILRGEVLSSLGRNEEAEADIKTEIAGTQNTKLLTDGWIALGVLYRRQERDAEAAAAFEKVAELAPARPESYAELANLYNKMGQPQKAADAFERARKVGAADSGALINVGISYLNKKDYAGAAQTFRRVIELDEKNANTGIAYAWLGRCQLHDGEIDAALDSLRKSLDLNPKGSLADETREILKAMEKK